MGNDPTVERAVQQYLDSVAASCASVSSEWRDTLLSGLREHIEEALGAQTLGRTPTLQDAYTVLATMDLPETYAEEAARQPSDGAGNRKLIALSLICSAMQIGGLLAVIGGVPVVGALVGIAAIVSFFLSWARAGTPRWVLRLMTAAAIAGCGLVAIEIARALH
jgi:hypothetical protein